MYSEAIKDALTSEVVGQPQAIDRVVRGVTRLVSGLTPVERNWCAYLFIGPPGTGRAHLVRVLSRILHGDETLFTVNCNAGGHADPWSWFVHQLAPLFARQGALPHAAERHSPDILLVQDLECARKEFFPMLARVLETGQLSLGGGRRGLLNNCLVFVTSGLCTDEILKTSRIGFTSASAEEGGEARDNVVDICRTEAEKTFGLDFLAQLDDLIVFRQLEEEHLGGVLDRHFARMSRWLAQCGVRCDLEPAARSFLLEGGNRRVKLGAGDLILAHRQEVEFPLADLLVSGQLAPGRCVVVDRVPGEAHLHFTVRESRDGGRQDYEVPGVRAVPVAAGPL